MDEDPSLGLHEGMLSKINKISSKSHKMHRHLEEAISKTIQAIEDSEQEVMKAQDNWGTALHRLHVKMTEIKPLKSMKE